MKERWPVLLMSYGLDLGGSERQLVEIAKRLDPRRFDVHVGAFHTSGMRVKELHEANIPVVDIPVRSFRSPSTIGVARQFGSYLRRHRIALVHPFDPPGVIFGVPVARWCRVPVVLSSQRGERSFCEPAIRRALSITDHLVKGIVVNSNFVRQELIDRFDVAGKRIHLCHNGLDTNVFHPRGRRRPAQLEGASCVVGTISVLRREKSVETILRAVALLKPKHAGVRVLIVGSGESGDSLRALAGELGMTGDCVFVPATGDVAPWHRAIDIFVLPSLTEAFSNSLMEAIACGCCPVASRTGGNPEMVNEENGFLFEPGNASDLAGRLEVLLSNPDLCSRLATAGLKRIEADFTMQASVGRMTGIYDTHLEALRSR